MHGSRIKLHRFLRSAEGQVLCLSRHDPEVPIAFKEARLLGWRGRHILTTTRSGTDPARRQVAGFAKWASWNIGWTPRVLLQGRVAICHDATSSPLSALPRR